MESIINDYISRELINRQELLPLRNDTPLIESGILDSLALLSLLVFLENDLTSRWMISKLSRRTLIQ